MDERHLLGCPECGDMLTHVIFDEVRAYQARVWVDEDGLLEYRVRPGEGEPVNKKFGFALWCPDCREEVKLDDALRLDEESTNTKEDQ